MEVHLIICFNFVLAKRLGFTLSAVYTVEILYLCWKFWLIRVKNVINDYNYQNEKSAPISIITFLNLSRSILGHRQVQLINMKQLPDLVKGNWFLMTQFSVRLRLLDLLQEISGNNLRSLCLGRSATSSSPSHRAAVPGCRATDLLPNSPSIPHSSLHPSSTSRPTLKGPRRWPTVTIPSWLRGLTNRFELSSSYICCTTWLPV